MGARIAISCAVCFLLLVKLVSDYYAGVVRLFLVMIVICIFDTGSYLTLICRNSNFNGGYER